MENRIARGISWLFHPLLIPTYILLMVLNAGIFVSRPMPATYQWVLAGVIFLTTFLLPLVLTWFLRRVGLISSFYLTTREERVYPILAIAVFYYITYYLLRGSHIPAIFSYYMLGATLLAILVLAVNFFRKISLHMIAAGSITGLFLGLALNFGIDFRAEVPATILLAGVIGYARLKANSHEPAEIYAGFAMGAIVMTLLMILL